MNSLEMIVAPAARLEDLVLTESGDELLVFDTQRNELHHLDSLSASVWRQLDGHATEGDILATTREVLGDHVTAESIQLAIVGLGKANLLSGQVSPSISEGASSRRRFLKKAGLAASIPVIASVTAPLAAQAATPQACDVATTECTLANIGQRVCCDCGGGLLQLAVGLCLAVGPIGLNVCATVCVT